MFPIEMVVSLTCKWSNGVHVRMNILIFMEIFSVFWQKDQTITQKLVFLRQDLLNAISIYWYHFYVQYFDCELN